MLAGFVRSIALGTSSTFRRCCRSQNPFQVSQLPSVWWFLLPNAANLDGTDDESSKRVRDNLFRQCDDSMITQSIDRAVAALESDPRPVIYSGGRPLA